MTLTRSSLCLLALNTIAIAAFAAPAVSPKTPATADQRQQEAVNKQLARMNNMKPTDFCMKKLRKLARVKGVPEENWFTALTRAASSHGVNGHHMTLVQDRQVEIGMPMCAAIAAWGQPRSINKTQTANGRREQWVYGTGNYLYFGDEQLVTSIQTSR